MRPQMPRPEKGVSSMPKTPAQARPANLGQTLRRLLSYMGHAKFSLLAVGVLASVAAIASLAGTYMVRPIVNGLATGGEELLTKQVFFTAAIYAAGVLSALGYSQIMVRAAQRVVSDIRRAFAAPKNIGAAELEALRAIFRKICEDPEYVADMEKAGQPHEYMEGEAFAAYIESLHDSTYKALDEAGLLKKKK